MITIFAKFPKLVCRNYREHVSRYPCLNCGAPGPSDPHHDRRHGNCGMGMKPPDTYCIPLCHKCHVLSEGYDVPVDAALKFMINSITEFITKGGNFARKN